MTNPEPLLTVTDLSKSFPARRSMADALKRQPAQRLIAVDGVSLEVAKHQTIGVVGESGSGKSTLAKCLVRLMEPEGGSVRFGAVDVTRARRKELARVRRSMQLIYQDPYSSLNPTMTVEQALVEPGRVHGLVSKERGSAYVGELLDMVGLAQTVAKRRPHELSGGQRQRVAIARAMAVQPELLIADEAVSALDVSIQAQILNLFEKLRDEQGVAIVFISHQLSVIAHIADTVMVMYLGRIVETGPTERVFRDPRHPYTAALLQSQPGRHRRRQARKAVLRGEIPSPLEIPSGCRFRTRCPIAQEVCAQVDPPAVELGDGHRSWCHFATEERSHATQLTKDVVDA